MSDTAVPVLQYSTQTQPPTPMPVPVPRGFPVPEPSTLLLGYGGCTVTVLVSVCVVSATVVVTVRVAYTVEVVGSQKLTAGWPLPRCERVGVGVDAVADGFVENTVSTNVMVMVVFALVLPSGCALWLGSSSPAPPLITGAVTSSQLYDRSLVRSRRWGGSSMASVTLSKLLRRQISSRVQ
ncbi:hypothetical protein F5Y17DRAFT_300477 [Xylariaceae sp. FL0594]|nr:hypothetical protein F5Y17DRAFT_300477 [Xylariaceae sp. FL0594]